MSVLTIRPECPIVNFKQSGKDYMTFLNLDHFTQCDINEQGEKVMESGIVRPQIKDIAQLRRPRAQ